MAGPRDRVRPAHLGPRSRRHRRRGGRGPRRAPGPSPDGTRAAALAGLGGTDPALGRAGVARPRVVGPLPGGRAAGVRPGGAARRPGRDRRAGDRDRSGTCVGRGLHRCGRAPGVAAGQHPPVGRPLLGGGAGRARRCVGDRGHRGRRPAPVGDGPGLGGGAPAAAPRRLGQRRGCRQRRPAGVARRTRVRLATAGGPPRGRAGAGAAGVRHRLVGRARLRGSAGPRRHGHGAGVHGRGGRPGCRRRHAGAPRQPGGRPHDRGPSRGAR